MSAIIKRYLVDDRIDSAFILIKFRFLGQARSPSHKKKNLWDGLEVCFWDGLEAHPTRKKSLWDGLLARPTFLERNIKSND
ncbi:MAG: hypothetical protein EAZ23_26865 [Oscillatoriales cyanobacterium]|nr:MAG: hypothetical protein EAZ28_01945 [Oscillatoriales cyanobacterium]TAG69467.1 MAG: hypothetical protein EAZ23_26865 [Oscillatoriales cyanobacterium]